MQSDLEQRLISVIKDETIFSDVLSRNVSSEDFVMHAEIFEFITKYFYRYNSIPARAVIESAYPGFSYVTDTKESEVKFLCDELVKNTVQRKTINILNSTAELLQIDTYGAVDSLLEKLSTVRKNTQYSKSFTDKDALKRYDEAVANKNKIAQKILVGIKTGISFFDDRYIGWQPGNLIGIGGRLGIGKSWLLEYIACQAYTSGKRVLYLSPEMSTEEVGQRWDTILGQINGHTFLNDKLQMGDVDLKEYKSWLEYVAKRNDWMTLDSCNGKDFTLGNINSLVNEFSPDFVAFDGVSFIQAGGVNATWEKVKVVSNGLKSITQNHKIVFAATTQVNRTVGDDMPRTDQVSDGDTFMQAVNIGIMVQADINKPMIRYITIPKVRSGKAMNTPLEVQFDVNKGIIRL